jgi:hippurate hydrolase
MNAPLPLPALDAIRQHEDEMVAIRRQIHSNPELAYEEHATSDLVAERLQRWGYEVHRGLGGTGVVGTLHVGGGSRHIGLRADMDALPIGETSGKPWASKVFGKMHACGHDGYIASAVASIAVRKRCNSAVRTCTWCSSPPKKAWPAPSACSTTAS